MMCKLYGGKTVNISLQKFTRGTKDKRGSFHTLSKAFGESDFLESCHAISIFFSTYLFGNYTEVFAKKFKKQVTLFR